MKRFIKKLPPGTQIGAGRGFETLSIWGDAMAFVDYPDIYDQNHAPEYAFDAERIARRYTVMKTDLPVRPEWVGKTVHWRDGSQKYWDTSFSFADGFGYPRRMIEGRVQKPDEYWVEVGSFSDLGRGETAAVLRVLGEKGYREARRYPLTAGKWKKLLGQTWEETQANDDYDLANAADEIGGPSSWDEIPGVFALTRKDTIKFIVSRGRGKL